MTPDERLPDRETGTAQSNSAPDLKSCSSGSGILDTPGNAEADLRAYFEAVYGASIGRAHMTVGSGPRLTDRHRYDFAAFTSSSFAWPDQADALVHAILHANAAGETDVYVCPNLMQGSSRTKGGAVARWTVHADVDDDLDLCKVRQVGGWAVASGSEGHGQVYVTLTDSVPRRSRTTTFSARLAA